MTAEYFSHLTSDKKHFETSVLIPRIFCRVCEMYEENYTHTLTAPYEVPFGKNSIKQSLLQASVVHNHFLEEDICF